MAITFHCSFCGKKIEAKEGATGKWGKCPSCHNKIYVPNLNAEDNLKLAPVDESEEERKKQLMAETYKVEQEILSEREAPGESNQAVQSTPATEMDDERLMKNVITYLRQMADGKLDQAESLSNLIVGCGDQALKIIDMIALSDIPEPELADIPQQVLSGLIRTLRSRIT